MTTESQNLLPLAPQAESGLTRFVEEFFVIAIDIIFFIDLLLTFFKLFFAQISFYNPYLMNDTDDTLPSFHTFYNIWRLANKNKKSKGKYATLFFLASGQAIFNTFATYFILHPWLVPLINFAAAPLFFIGSAWFTTFRLFFLAVRAHKKSTIPGLIKDRQKSLAQYEKMAEKKSLTTEQITKQQRLVWQLDALEAVQNNQATETQKLLVDDLLAYEKTKRNLYIAYTLFVCAISIAVTAMVFFPPAAPFSLIVIAGIVCGTMLALCMKDYCKNLYSAWLKKDMQKKLDLKDNKLEAVYAAPPDNRIKPLNMLSPQAKAEALDKTLFLELVKENSKFPESKKINAVEYWDNLPAKARETVLQQMLTHAIENKNAIKNNEALLIFQWWKYELSFQKPESFRAGAKGMLKTAVILLFTPFILLTATSLGLKNAIGNFIEFIRKPKASASQRLGNETVSTLFHAPSTASTGLDSNISPTAPMLVI